jgi:hypothetical protein
VNGPAFSRTGGGPTPLRLAPIVRVLIVRVLAEPDRP